MALKTLYRAEKMLMGPPPIEGNPEPAAEWEIGLYTITVLAHLAGSGEPMPCHDAKKVFLLFWLMCALLVGGKYNDVCV